MSAASSAAIFTPEQLAAYLARIGIEVDRALPAPALDSLQDIYRAHHRTVPFENFDILPLGRPLVLEPPAIYDKIVGHRRGGYCYELNGLLGAVLRDLGYEVTYAAAQFVEEGGLSAEFDHLVLIVRLPGDTDRWVIDAAGGRHASMRPLLLRDGAVTDDPETGFGFRFSGDDDRWQLDLQHGDAAWQPIYVFAATPRSLADFRARSDYHEFDPASHFRQGPLCSIATPTGRITFSQNRLITTTGADRDERDVSPDEIPALLRQHFGVDLETEWPTESHQKEHQR